MTWTAYAQQVALEDVDAVQAQAGGNLVVTVQGDRFAVPMTTRVLVLVWDTDDALDD